MRNTVQCFLFVGHFDSNLQISQTLRSCRAALSVAVLAAIFSSSAFVTIQAQGVVAQAGTFTVNGKVESIGGQSMGNVRVELGKNEAVFRSVAAKPNGEFSFQSVPLGDYSVVCVFGEGARSEDRVSSSIPGEVRNIVLKLRSAAATNSSSSASHPNSVQQMEFSDQPSFTIAGVTDWTAAGGHGSDTTLRTSEALVREAVSQRSKDSDSQVSTSHSESAAASENETHLREALGKDPTSFKPNHDLGSFLLHAGKSEQSIPFLLAAFEKNHADSENEFELAQAYHQAGQFASARKHINNLIQREKNTDWLTFAGEVDEKLNDPVSAARDFEEAVQIAPTEDHYFNWGSELLYHRAVLEAEKILAKGSSAFPQSMRLLMALGAAQFTNARYDDAAKTLCSASDVDPADKRPYEFLAQVNTASPTPLTCAKDKLAYYQKANPHSSEANYLYAMSLWKDREKTPSPELIRQVRGLLERAVQLDSKCADGYLQLGNVSASQNDYSDAIAQYKTAIGVNPQFAEAHYRLGVAYKRTGKQESAAAEFALHKKIRADQAADVDKERRAIKQFVINDPSTHTSESPSEAKN